MPSTSSIAPFVREDVCSTHVADLPQQIDILNALPGVGTRALPARGKVRTLEDVAASTLLRPRLADRQLRLRAANTAEPVIFGRGVTAGLGGYAPTKAAKGAAQAAVDRGIDRAATSRFVKRAVIDGIGVGMPLERILDDPKVTSTTSLYVNQAIERQEIAVTNRALRDFMSRMAGIGPELSDADAAAKAPQEVAPCLAEQAELRANVRRLSELDQADRAAAG